MTDTILMFFDGTLAKTESNLCTEYIRVMRGGQILSSIPKSINSLTKPKTT
jgi:hypothetical protein